MVSQKNKARDLRKKLVKNEYFRVLRIIIGIERGFNEKNGNKYNKC